MSDFFKSMVKAINDENTSILDDGEGSAEFTGTIDTGAYILNAAMTGSIYGGVPNNKITCYAGEAAVGKTFFILQAVRCFLESNPSGAVFYFDTEAAVTKEMMVSRGIDPKRVIISEPETIQKFRHVALQVLDAYCKQDRKERPPMMLVLDSLGQLSTNKEVEDSSAGSDTKDMTKAATIKATFRVLALKLAKAGVPLLISNHVYETMSLYSTKKMGGGSGPLYLSSVVE
jgi:RecA/RadA recombinase